MRSSRVFQNEKGEEREGAKSRPTSERKADTEETPITPRRQTHKRSWRRVILTSRHLRHLGKEEETKKERIEKQPQIRCVTKIPKDTPGCVEKTGREKAGGEVRRCLALREGRVART